MVKGSSKKGSNAIRESSSNILANAKGVQKNLNGAWNCAARCPMFCRIKEKVLSDGTKKKLYRSARLVSAHAIKIAATGAAMNAQQTLGLECQHLRMDVMHESSRAPWMPTVSPGARFALEHFLCALAQEAALKADIIRGGSGSSQRVSQKHMAAAWDMVFEDVFATTTFMPKRNYNLFVHKKKAAPKKAAAPKKKRQAQEEDEDFEDPADDNEVGGGDGTGDIQALDAED